MPFRHISNNYVQKGPTAPKTAPKADKNGSDYFGFRAKRGLGEGLGEGLRSITKERETSYRNSYTP